MYPEELVQPMREELTNFGVKECKTAEEVDSSLKEFSGTSLVVINSVCGCAAGNARPAVQLASKHEKLPDQMITTFAGNDKEATTRAREYFIGFPPSSPSMGLIKNGEVVHMIERHQIEGRMAGEIARELIQAFEDHC